MAMEQSHRTIAAHFKELNDMIIEKFKGNFATLSRVRGSRDPVSVYAGRLKRVVDVVFA